MNGDAVRAVYPFAAVVGQEEAKLALLLHAVHQGLGGVLLSGKSGMAKTVLLRGIAELVDDRAPAEIPLGVTEDRLWGSLDLQTMLRSGVRRLQPGLLAEANGRSLLADHFNLLPPAVAFSIVEASQTGSLRLEREGFSASVPAVFRLFAAVQPEEGEVSPGLFGAFGLYVQLQMVEKLAERQEIIRRQLEYEDNPEAFVQRYAAATAALRLRIAEARHRLAFVAPEAAAIRLAVQLAREARCQGQRRELAAVEAARALAAWEGRSCCTEADISRVAAWTLEPWSQARTSPQKQPLEGCAEETAASPVPEERPPAGGAAGSDETAAPGPDGDDGGRGEELGASLGAGAAALNGAPSDTEAAANGASTAEPLKVEAAGQAFAIRPIAFQPGDRKPRSGAGRRNLTRSGTPQGRYVGFRRPSGQARAADIALDATLRAAAPFQAVRRRDAGGGRVVILPEDLRQKVRERRTGTAILLAVDASGSMAARKRMAAVKGAVLSLLQDAYQKRDRIGLLAFRGTAAEEVLPLTRSVDLAMKQLRELPSGGRTPLAQAIRQGWKILERARRKDKELIPALVLVTDGRANQALDGSTSGSAAEVLKECLAVARAFRESGLHALVIDTEQGFIRLEQAAQLAEALGADYCRLEELDGAGVAAAVRQMVKGDR
ncbi:VWA domain-containing protein [Paenibacillus mesotrionivorans]|uniref:VWA domain-containing protein n=1 Tax=Paenibacillus mesotrionivorans TaxID=3160968 RepID=A0ACC7P5Q0_9BACL